ncbi:MAG: putative secreted protein [Pseudomonadota bacterium]|jgi:tripartite-type tricarboxylate transporter receptor subunit TctC
MKTFHTHHWWSLALALSSALGMGTAHAQGAEAAFPDRSIRLIVPYPPGGSTDPAARLIASDIGPRLGQNVVVENRAGAAGAIGTEAVARAAPDGYTLLLHTSVISTDPTLKKNAPYDVKRDLAPVTLAVNGPYLLVVNPSLPVRNVAELITYAKANPGKLNFGSAGQASSGHLIGELFKKAAGIDMVHVPYKGGGPSIVGLVGNEVQLVFDTFGGSRALAESGKLRAIAVTSPNRASLMPDIPTVSESGLKDFSAVYWLGIFAPAKTPPAIIDKLHGVIRQSLETPAVKAKMLDIGNVPQALSPTEFGRVLDADIQRYRAIIDSARITLD